jgi:hypothetical protein
MNGWHSGRRLSVWAKAALEFRRDRIGGDPFAVEVVSLSVRSWQVREAMIAGQPDNRFAHSWA